MIAKNDFDFNINKELFLARDSMEDHTFDTIVIGSGPAGLTAALYTCRANLKTLVVAGYKYGGQLMITTVVENYPGFPDGIMGPELMEKMIKQVENHGAKIVYEDVVSVNFKNHPFEVRTESNRWYGRSVIIATGAQSKWLGLESEQRLIGKGVSSCATCDGPLFKGKKVVVVGGGDSAMEEALFLAGLASEVTIVHRRDKFRASKIMQQRVFKNDKINIIWNHVVTEVLGDQKVEGVRIKNVITGEESILGCDGLFIAIGHKPSTDVFAGQIELDERGYVMLKNGTETSVKGVFAAGDVHDYKYRQAVTAAGFGCMAAMDCIKFLEEQESPHRVKPIQQDRQALPNP